ncbi:hypothetical protein CPB85DRAFT_290567 [Mucidula mucida]|nr:hypothetical protein CPB85DRAFT_290567 [Mucidula mucida]
MHLSTARLPIQANLHSRRVFDSSGLYMEQEPTRLSGSLTPFLSNNNAPPNESFSDELRKERDAQIAHIDMEILRLQKQREEMTLAYQQALSPVRRVPPEVWGRIFAQCSQAGYRGSYNHKSEPWVISHVCSTWRTIVTSMSALWSYVYCSPASLDTVNPTGLLDLVLSRAGDKLNVVFRYKSFPTRPPRCTPEEIEEGMTGLFRVVVRYCRLWRDASLHIASNHLDILHTIEEDIHNLRRISLFVGTYPIDSMGPTVRCFRVAPKLTSVHLSGSLWNAAEAFPWAQITNYDGFAGVHAPSNTNLFEVIIRTAKDLRTARFSGKGIPRVVPPSR